MWKSIMPYGLFSAKFLGIYVSVLFTKKLIAKQKVLKPLH